MSKVSSPCVPGESLAANRAWLWPLAPIAPRLCVSGVLPLVADIALAHWRLFADVKGKASLAQLGVRGGISL